MGGWSRAMKSIHRPVLTVVAACRGTNLVIFPANLVEDDDVEVHDPDDGLPHDQLSWR